MKVVNTLQSELTASTKYSHYADATFINQNKLTLSAVGYRRNVVFI